MIGITTIKKSNIQIAHELPIRRVQVFMNAELRSQNSDAVCNTELENCCAENKNLRSGLPGFLSKAGYVDEVALLLTYCSIRVMYGGKCWPVRSRCCFFCFFSADRPRSKKTVRPSGGEENRNNHNHKGDLEKGDIHKKKERNKQTIELDEKYIFFHGQDKVSHEQPL